MTKSTTAMQATIEGLLATEPMTAQEIADKSGATVALVRLAITTLEHKGKMVSVGHRPVRYCAPAKPAKARAGITLTRWVNIHSIIKWINHR
ncbi:hypothetical protein Acife_1183 [Acidithiobacillus ferrivorans SS3]|uniref:Uncharacterized protein n=1 Tax=Acidithiobacillus ferrivorans SS3 TaxID=743299 RepID=G0JPB1_9PROT|nr:hypothetical protein [Acidithiobacillus ferrivorans]AEM47342.1 hypothetical protein Acife_1183 [Acidithiobacillus ferrivorans SS3]